MVALVLGKRVDQTLNLLPAVCRTRIPEQVALWARIKEKELDRAELQVQVDAPQ